MYLCVRGIAGADPGFQVRGGGALKKIATKIFGVFRVKNNDFTPKNNIFSNFRGAPPPLDPPLYRLLSLSTMCLLVFCLDLFCFSEQHIHQYVFIIKNTQSSSRQKET